MFSRKDASSNVVLVDENDNQIGIQSKKLAHNNHTKLHRGFSCFLLNSKNQILVQKRSNQKITWPDFWSNSFCGHPQEFETYQDALLRHARFELNLKINEVKFISKYRYRFEYNEIVENEICPIFIAYLDEYINSNDIKYNPDEISEIKWIEVKKFDEFLNSNINVSPWCIEEFKILKDIYFMK